MFRTHYEGTFGVFHRRNVVRKTSMKIVWSRIMKLAGSMSEDDYLPF